MADEKSHTWNSTSYSQLMVSLNIDSQNWWDWM